MVSSADYNLTTTIGESQSTNECMTRVNELNTTLVPIELLRNYYKVSPGCMTSTGNDLGSRPSRIMESTGIIYLPSDGRKVPLLVELQMSEPRLECVVLILARRHGTCLRRGVMICPTHYPHKWDIRTVVKGHPDVLELVDSCG